jgi:hypothetical protein
MSRTRNMDQLRRKRQRAARWKFFSGVALPQIYETDRRQPFRL